MNLIDRYDLSTDAVVPQSLDNQFLTSSTLQKMMEKRIDFSHPAIQEIRTREKKREYIRTLIYSSQVVVNRAFLINDFCLHAIYKDANERKALAQLIKDNKMIFYLMSQNTIVDSLDFSAPNLEPLNTLLADVGTNYTAVKFALNENENEKGIDILRGRFTQLLSSLAQSATNDSLFDIIVKDVFVDTAPTKSTIDEFKNLLIDISDAAYISRGKMTREEVYRTFFVKPTSAETSNEWVTSFRLDNATMSDAVFGAKKVVDLIYNANLPKLLNARVFSPLGFPSNYFVYFDTFNIQEKGDSAQLNTSFQDAAKIAEGQMGEAMSLPLFETLTIQDVLEIHTLPEWGKFIDKQRLLTAFGDNTVQHFEDYADALRRLNKAISKWAIQKNCNTPNKMDLVKAFFVPALTLGFFILGQNYEFDLLQPFQDEFAALAIAQFSKLASTENIRIFQKVRNNFFDKKTMELRQELSYNLATINKEYKAAEINLIEVLQTAKKTAEKSPFYKVNVAEISPSN